MALKISKILGQFLYYYSEIICKMKSSGGGCPDCLSAPVYESENVEHQGQGITIKGNQVFFLCGRGFSYILYSYNNDPIKTMKT